MKFAKGTTVQCYIGGIMVDGVIESVKNNGNYIVKFDNDIEQELPEKKIQLSTNDLRPTSRSSRRSPSRRSPTRRSPARRSPARRSPARKAKASPSPSRTKPPSSRTTTTPSARILKVTLDKIDDIVKVNDTINFPSFPKRRQPIEKSIDLTVDSGDDTYFTNKKSDIIKTEDITVAYAIQESVARARIQESDKILHLKQTANLISDLGKFSDDDDIYVSSVKSKEEIDRKSEPRIFAPPREFGGWFGSFILITLIPLFAITLNIICSVNSCSYKQIHYSDFKKYNSIYKFVSMEALFTYLSYVLLIFLIAAIPFGGRKVKSQPGRNQIFLYNMNGLFTAFIVLGTIFALEIYNVSIINIICDKFFELMISAILFAFVSSVLFFIRSKFVPVSQLNSHAVTYNFTYDFFMGREVNPRLLRIDLKMVYLRASYIAVLIINSAYLFKSLYVQLTKDNIFNLDKISLEPTVLILCSIYQILYILDWLFFEFQLTTTFELQYEGLGYMKLMTYAVYPFLLTATTRYIYNQFANDEAEQGISYWAVGGNLLLFLAGYILYRGSNSQKHAFRLNPYDPALLKLESIPTSQGKKLLISGYWGKMRHPNYLGDILLHLAMCSTCICAPAALGVILPILMLIYRARRDSERCKRKYGLAWDRYTHKVRHMLIPKLY